MSQLIPFLFESFPVRVIRYDDGNWSVVAKDLAAALEYADSSNPARLFCIGVVRLSAELLRALDSHRKSGWLF